MVVIPLGASTPFVLRRMLTPARACDGSVPRESAYYLLVSDSYVHGVMDGEVVKLLNGGKVKAVEYVIL